MCGGALIIWNKCLTHLLFFSRSYNTDWYITIYNNFLRFPFLTDVILINVWERERSVEILFKMYTWPWCCFFLKNISLKVLSFSSLFFLFIISDVNLEELFYPFNKIQTFRWMEKRHIVHFAKLNITLFEIFHILFFELVASIFSPIIKKYSEKQNINIIQQLI